MNSINDRISLPYNSPREQLLLALAHFKMAEIKQVLSQSTPLTKDSPRNLLFINMMLKALREH